MWTDVQFWKDASWRSFRTFCQTLAALLGGQTFTALTAPWQSMLSVAFTASLISLFQSIDRGRSLTTSGPKPIEVLEEAPQESAQESAPVAQVIPLGAAHAVVTSCGDKK